MTGFVRSENRARLTKGHHPGCCGHWFLVVRAADWGLIRCTMRVLELASGDPFGLLADFPQPLHAASCFF